MTGREAFESQITAMTRELGPRVADANLRVIAEALGWVRRDGHGSLTMSAVDHRLGRRFKAETFVTIEDDHRR